LEGQKRIGVCGCLSCCFCASQTVVKDGAIEGIEINESSNLKSCDSCEYAKAICKAICKVWEVLCTTRFGDEIHMDLWGPSPVQSPGGMEYYASFTDDNTRYTCLYLLRRKDETFEAYKSFEAWAETQHKSKIKRLHSDEGGEYLDGEFSKYLVLKGTEWKQKCCDRIPDITPNAVKQAKHNSGGENQTMGFFTKKHTNHKLENWHICWLQLVV
jgi:hypothetical protein